MKMRKVFKRLTAAVLALSMAVSSVPAGAETTKTQDIVITVSGIKERVEDLLLIHYGNSLVESDIIVLGNDIPCYNYAGGIYTKMDYVKIYPVYKNKIIIGTVKETIVNGISSFSYSEEYAVEIKNFLSYDNFEYNFIFENDNLFICSNNDIDFISSYTPATEKNTATFNLKTVKALDFYSQEGENVILNINNSEKAGTITSELSIPTWNQGSSGLCWAGTVEAIGEFITGNKAYTPYTIASTLGIGSSQGIYMRDIPNAFSQIYGLSAIRMGNVPSFSYLVYNINSNKPMYMGLQATSTGHATTLIGYGATSSQYYVKIMDTYGGLYRTLEFANETASFYIGSNLYTWNDTVRIS